MNLGIQLANGRLIPPQYIGMVQRKIDITGADSNEPHLRLLQFYKMPLDLDCFFCTIDGDGIGEPEYFFQFIGVIIKGKERLTDRSALPFAMRWIEPSGALTRQIAYTWQRLIILKSDYQVKSWCAESHNGRLIFLPPSPLQQVLDLHISSHLPRAARTKETTRLMRGYDVMIKLFDNIAVKCKYTPSEAEQLAKEIIEAAQSYIARWVRQKEKKGKKGKRSVRNIVSFEAVAQVVKKSKGTLLAVNESLIFAGLKSLEARLKEIEQQERQLAEQDERKFINSP